MSEVNKVTKNEVFSRYAVAVPNKAFKASASGINTKYVEPKLQGIERRGKTYSHTWLVNVDVIPSDYAGALVKLFASNPDGLEWRQLNGYNLVIKMRVNRGDAEPELPLRGEQIKMVISKIVTKDGITLTHDKNVLLKGKPHYEVKSYQLLESVEALSMSDYVDSPRQELPMQDAVETAPVKTSVNTEQAPF
jgi:hypothetical protein